MTSEPPPSPDSPDDGTLGAFAAGELPEAQAAEIRARAAVDPVLAARVEGALRVEAALRDGLREEAGLPVPLSLLSSVLERVRREAASGQSSSDPDWPGSAVRQSSSDTDWRRSGGWAAAAAVLALFLGLAPAVFGVESVAAAAEPLRESLGDAERALRAGAVPIVPGGATVEALAPVSDRVPGGAPVLGAAGVVVLAAGLWLARGLGAGGGGSKGGAR